MKNWIWVVVVGVAIVAVLNYSEVINFPFFG